MDYINSLNIDQRQRNLADRKARFAKRKARYDAMLDDVRQGLAELDSEIDTLDEEIANL